MNEEIMRESQEWTIFYLLTSASCTENEGPSESIVDCLLL